MNNTEQPKDLYDRFFEDLEKAVKSGTYHLPYVGEDTDGDMRYDTTKGYTAVLGVIKKYSANPHEPIQNNTDERTSKG